MGQSDDIRATSATIPYSFDFKNDDEISNWVLLNEGQTRKWVFGSKYNTAYDFLYITHTAEGYLPVYGPVYDLTISLVYAYRSINFSKAGVYEINFNYLAYFDDSENNTQAFLVPDSIMLEAGNAYGMIGDNNTAPENWIPVSGILPTYYDLQKITNKNVIVPEAGYYNLVFFCKNGGYAYSAPFPTAAILKLDINLIEQCSDPVCRFYEQIASYATATENVVVEVDENITLPELVNIPVPETKGITLKILSKNPEEIITLKRGIGGDLFTIPFEATLIVENVIIDGDRHGDFSKTGEGSLFKVETRGFLIMNSGEIRGNIADSCGGVHIAGGEFIMKGGLIIDNSADLHGNAVGIIPGIGGGIIPGTGGGFTMNGGVIFGKGDAVSIVVQVPYQPSDFQGSGIIIAWNEPTNDTPYIYTLGANTDLKVYPRGVLVDWAKKDGAFGITYSNGTNTGFIPIEGIILESTTGITPT